MAGAWRRTVICVRRSADVPSAGCGRTRGEHGVAALQLGATAQAGVCAGHGALPVVSRGDAADHCRHHAGRGHPEDPPASETVCRPPSHGTGPCPPGSLCLVLCLTAPRVSPPRLRPLPWGGTTPPPSPPPPDVSPHTARGWGGMAVRCPPRTPRASRGCL